VRKQRAESARETSAQNRFDRGGCDVDGPAAGRAPQSFPATPDHSAPIFFFSHANALATRNGTSGASADEPFLTFFTDLSLNVNQLVYRPPGADPGFVDKGLSTGVDWEHEILTAVSTCQVFIALISEPYIHRAWCGKEWDAFARRRTWHMEQCRVVDSPCIIPVVWAPLGARNRPRAVMARQLFTPKDPRDAQVTARYRAEGIFGLLKTDHDAYSSTVWILAKEIQRLVFDYWVEPCETPGIDDLRNVFREEAP
jgi:hypothetical protein